jgi:hypothetical protein
VTNAKALKAKALCPVTGYALLGEQESIAMTIHLTSSQATDTHSELATSRVAEQQRLLTARPESARTTLRAGTDSAAAPDNPELLPALKVLQALAQCHEQTYRLYAEALGIPLDSVQVRLQAAMDLRGVYAAADRIRAGFGQLAATVEISSPADIYEIERLRVTVERHSPVLDLVRNPTPVKIELVLTHNETAPAAA